MAYFKEATELIKGYKPIANKLGEPYYFKKVQLNDNFNYVDEKMARVIIFLINICVKDRYKFDILRQKYRYKVKKHQLMCQFMLVDKITSKN